MPFNPIKDLINGVKNLLFGKTKAAKLFEQLKADPGNLSITQEIKELFAKNPVAVVTEVLRRIDISRREKETGDDSLFVQFRRTWRNTIKKQVVQPLQLITPSTKEELSEIVRNAEKQSFLVRAVGAGHSFSDVANATDILVSMLKLNKVLNVETDTLKNAAAVLFSCQSGIMVKEVNDELDKRGLALPTMAAFDRETLYGAIATSTHGTGIRVDGMPAMVRSMDIIAAGGKCYRLEPADGITDPAKFNAKYANGSVTLIQDDDKFHSAVVGFGLMGLVYSIVIEPVKTFYLKQRLWVTKWEEVKPRLENRSFFIAIDENWTPIAKDSHGNYPPTRAQVFVNPYITKNFITKKETHTCVVQTQVEISKEEFERLNTQVKEKTKSKLASFIEELLSNGAKGVHEVTVKAEDKNSIVEEISTDGLLELLNLFPTLTPVFIDISMIALLSGSGKFGKSYTVMNQGKLAVKNAGYSVEPGLPVDKNNLFIKGAEEMMRVAELGKESHSYITAPACMRFVKAAKEYLSPEYNTDTCMMDVPMILGTIGDDQVFDRLQLDFVALGARPHWGKICNLVNGEELVRKMYPKFDKFAATIAFFNPNGTFNSTFSYRTGITKMEYNRPASS